MADVIRSPRARNDIKRVLQYTIKKWGEAQAWEYSALIEEALVAIGADPGRGYAVTSARPGIFRYHLKQVGRNARHVLFYRIGTSGTVEIVRLLHDSMDFERHLP
jgi:toxin ParE1/3/4